jgi:hypothetical protein
MDRGLWITWYDVPGERADFLRWMNGVWMPKMLANPGVLWAAHYQVEQKPTPARVKHTNDAAVAAGNDYILIFGAESAHAFARNSAHYFKGAPDRWAMQESAEDKAMLARRTNVRTAIMTEEERCHGVEAGHRDGRRLPAPCIQLGSFNGPTPEIEQELLAWYADWRLRILSQVPGALGMRKLVGTVGWNKHGVMYEFTSLEGRAQAMAEVTRRSPQEAEWTEVCVPKLVHAPGSPHIAVRVHELEK